MAKKIITSNEENSILEEFKHLNGANSEVLMRHHASGDKSVVLKFGAKKGKFSLGESQEMAKDIIEYERLLVSRGVPMPKTINLAIEFDPETNRSVITKTSVWAGEELGRLVSKLDKEKDSEILKQLLEKALGILFSHMRDRKGWHLRVGIDSRATNFTVDENEKMWFVDLFPPRYRKNEIPIVEWPEPITKEGKELGYFKHYDVRGVMLIFLSQLGRVRPDLRLHLEEILWNNLSRELDAEEYAEMVKEYKKTPWVKVRDFLNSKDTNGIQEIIRITRNAKKEKVFGLEYSVYSLREIALELGAAGKMNQEEIEAYFRDSHFEDSLSEEKIRSLEDALISKIEKM